MQDKLFEGGQILSQLQCSGTGTCFSQSLTMAYYLFKNSC